MAHIDVPARAALVKNKWTVLWVATGVAFVALLVIGAINFASRAGGSGGTASVPTGAYQQIVVGEVDEVAVRLPPRSWWDLDIDKPVIIRLNDGWRFERWPDGSIFKIETDGRLTPVATVGDVIPGSVIYLTAKKGEKMARVTVTVVRKAPTETKSVPTPPAPPMSPAVPATPSTGPRTKVT